MRACARSREKEREKEGERKEEMDLAKCIIATLKALRVYSSFSCLARERRGFYACSLKHERVSLCNKHARAARTICVTYAHNAVITNDTGGRTNGRSEKKRTKEPYATMRKDA